MPIYAKFRALQDNYEHRTGEQPSAMPHLPHLPHQEPDYAGVAEDITRNRAEQREQAQFLDTVLASRPMQELYNYLHRDRPAIFASRLAVQLRWKAS